MKTAEPKAATDSRPAARSWRPALVACLLAGSAAIAACKQDPAQDLSAAQLSFVVQAHQPALKNCYEVALSQRPYRGEMRMQAVLDITPEGRVASVDLQGGGGLPGMNKCLTEEIQRWQFPKAKDPTATSLPLIFQPEVKQPRGPDIEAFKKLMNDTRREDEK